MKMSALIPLVGLSMSLIFYSCEKETLEIAKKAEFSKPYILGFNEVSYLNDKDNTLKVTIMSISDLRCLEKKECESEGAATVRLNLSNLDNAFGETLLSISSSHVADSTIIKINDKKYLVKLLGVASGFNNTPNTGPVATLFISPIITTTIQ